MALNLNMFDKKKLVVMEKMVLTEEEGIAFRYLQVDAEIAEKGGFRRETSRELSCLMYDKSRIGDFYMWRNIST